MRFPIGRSTADIAVLLKTLDGDHRQSRASVVAAVAVVLICMWVLPTLTGTLADAQSLQDRITGWIIIGLCALLPLVMLAETLATFHVSQSGVTKRYPLGALSKHIGRADIFEIDLELEKGWHLIVVSASSRKLSVPVEGSLRTSLVKLYPEVAPYEPTAQDVRRWKILAAILVTLIVAVIIMFWWLGRAGLVAW